MMDMCPGVDVIHYQHCCYNALSKLSPVNESGSVSGWLSALCSILSDVNMMQSCSQLSHVDKQEILNEVLLREHGVQLRSVVNHFVSKYFKSSRKRKSLYKDQILLIKKFGFADMYKDDVLIFLNEQIERYIRKKLNGEYEEPVLPIIAEWISSALLKFCSGLFDDCDVISLKKYFEIQARVALSHARANELFDMIRDFPDSTPAIIELREVSQSSGMMSFIGKTLKRSLCVRLLHLGASTSDIIDVYVKMIRSFRLLDPSNLLLNFVAKPIRKYLVGRKDTIRCIVSSLTEGDDDNLHSELRAGGSLEYGAGNDSDDDEEDSPDITWTPPKRALDFPGSGEGGQTKDVLALLVSIYGSTDLFVSEYRSILAGRLLQNYEYFSDVEVKTLELLKIRFGEEPLHSCEVMLHDIDSSKRLNTAVMSEIRSKRMNNSPNDEEDSDTVVNYCIVSDEYWPSLHLESTISHHPRASRLQNEFSETFDDIKKPKKLEVAPQLGQVFLELDFNDGTTCEFSVSPTQATLILLLADDAGGKASIQFLADKSDLAESDVRKRMVYWVSRHVVREVVIPIQGNTGIEDDSGMDQASFSLGYEIIEEQEAEVAKRDMGESSQRHTAFEMSGDEDIGTSGVSVEAEESLALSSYEVYIRGMLQSQDGMHLERIHSMLKMVAAGVSSGVRYDLSIVQLRKFLQTLITADKLEIVDGLYKLRK